MGEVQPPIGSEAGTARAASTSSRARVASQDLQSLLASSLRQLAESTRASRACAWSYRPTGETYVVAADMRDASPPEAPDPASLEALEPVWRAGRPVDLGAGGADSPLGALAERLGFSAAAPLETPEHERIAILLIGGSEDLPGQVRPRTLAALDATVQRLRGPATADLARARLARVDDQVCRLDRLAAMGDLLAEVAHELRNPLVSVKTFLHLLPEHLEDPEFHGSFREVVTEELHRMERLLDTLLLHVRPGDGLVRAASGRERACLGEVFGSIVRLLAQRAADRQVELRVDVSAELPLLSIGEDPLRQILMNLVLNALDAAPAGSSVTLRGAAGGGGEVVFCVEDQGEGVSEADRAKLFEPFFSTRNDRVGGLGLAISKKLVEEAGGTIEVESAKGGGARFTVRLPSAPEPG